MLERAGQTRDSVQAFEVLLAERPEDPTILNALGYTLADHREQLPRAEKLIRQALLVDAGQSGGAGQPGLGAAAARAIRARRRAFSNTPTTSDRIRISRPTGSRRCGLSGSQAQARKVLNDALARHPESPALEATRHRLVPSSGHR